jgi:E3 ubiquitin-protein ligase UBR1
VLVAQIRAGLWVRNGFGMRAQQLHYKEYSLRENTFDQDIFFLQASLVILDPSLVLVAILDRFDVTEWLLGADSHGTYEPAQLFAVVEEMLYTVILLLSDDTYAAGLAPEVCIRKELIHNLCLGPSVYSDLMRRVSERFSDDPTLDRVLGEVAQFKPPSGVSDQGTYTLRPEFFAEVDPYFARYSRNQREEAEKVVREHLKKNSPNVEPVIVPKALHITAGPFASLSKAFDSHVLHQIIYYCMQHGRSRGALFSEVLVDEALHLSMLALVQQSHAFVKFALEEVFDVNTDAPTLVHLLVRVEEDDRMKSLRHKARWCLDRLQELVGPAVAALRKVEDTVAPAIALDANRLAAKARQAAIMAQFAQAQKAFLDSAENIDDEEDGVDEEMEGDDSVGMSLGSCIVCQDELNETKPFGSLALIQTSSIMRYTPAHDNSTYQSQVLSTPSDLDRDATETRRARFGDNDDDTLPQGFPPSSTNTGLHASACGHMMHQSCFETYYKSIEQRHHVQPTRCHPENTGRGEFTCPLCKSLGNVLLPAFPDAPTGEINGRDLDDWARTVMDPVANALEMQFLPDEVPIVLRHAATFHDTKLFGHIMPWRIDSSVTSGRPEFGSGNRLMAAQLLQVASALVLESSADEPVSLTSSLVGYTLAVTEIGSRGQAEAAESIPDPSLRMLSSLLALLRDLATFDMGTTKLTALVVLPHIGGIFGSALPQGDEKFGEPINTLLEVAAAVPASFYQAAAFCYYTELVEVFSGYRHLLDRSNETVAFEGKATDAELTDYAALAQLKRFVRHSDDPGPDDLTLGKALHAYSLPFLRRASILRRVLFGPSTHSSSAGSEMSRLLGVLRIPHPAIALRQDATGSASIQAHINACVAQRYPSPPSSSDPTSFDPRSVRRPLEHPAIYELVGLPHQLDSLAAESLERKCERCKQVPAEPAMCLFCGVIVCNQSFCCMDGEEEAQHGECNMHMWT